MPVFSIVIPVYNAEVTLAKCLESVKAQTFADFQAIMVENGSKDRSAEICREYADSDPRFVLISMSTNCGPSKARNAGLDNATGKYVTFIDSDDYVTPDYLSSLQVAFERKQSEVVFFGFNRVSMAGQNLSIHIPQIDERKTYLDKLIDLTSQDAFGYTWIKAFRRDCLGDMRFPTDLNLFEDEVFTCQVMGTVKNIEVIPRALYNYVVGNSTSLVGRTHRDYPQKCDRVYRAWSELLCNCEKKEALLIQKANAATFRCMYYCYERDIEVVGFVHALAESAFFAAHTNWTDFDLLVKERKVMRIRVNRAVYRAKNKISKLIRG